MSMDIQRIGNPVLREKARLVEADDPALPGVIQVMEQTLKDVNGLGLASNQVGVLKRVFVYDIGEGLQVMVNPEIVWASDEKVTDMEGCLSIPGTEFTITRAERIRLEGYDLAGDKKTVEAEGLLARIFQHEIDHLNGTMIIDRASEEEKREAMKKIIGTQET